MSYIIGVKKRVLMVGDKKRTLFDGMIFSMLLLLMNFEFAS